MKLFLTLIILGLIVTVLGFAILFGAVGGPLPIEASYVGFAMIILGPLTFVAGLVVYALQAPTPEQLAAQNPDNFQTWHFRPRGLLLLFLGLIGFIALGTWAEQYLPGINKGRRPLSGYIFAIVFMALLSIRKVRNWVLYTSKLPQANATSDNSEQPTEAEQPRD